MAKKNQILTHEQIVQKIRRIAYEITERNYTAKEINLVGIVGTGFLFAELLSIEISKIDKLKVSVSKLSLDKKNNVQSEIELEKEINSFKDSVVILVDDVLNSGRTMAYCLKPFLNIKVKNVQTAVLVDRDHKDFPIKADYVGYALSTTLKEHIEVDFEDKNSLGVYLN